MSGVDRTRLVELLEQLGAESNEDALAAAREANRLVVEGSSWREVLGASVAEETPTRDLASAPAAGGSSGDLRTVERLLARRDISDTLRSDLEDFRRQLATGKLDAMDADYIRALAKRLG